MIDVASIPSLMRLGLFELGRKIGLFRGFNHTLTIKVYDKKGKLIAVRFVRQRLILTNFRKLILFSILGHNNRWDVGELTITLTGEDGVTISPITWHDLDRETFMSAYHVGMTPVKIAIGTSTVAPTRDDYALGSKVAEAEAPTVVEGADWVTYAQAFTLVTGADITEAGFFIKCYELAGVVVKWVMLFRDTFTAVSVPDGGTIAITEKVTI